MISISTLFKKIIIALSLFLFGGGVSLNAQAFIFIPENKYKVGIDAGITQPFTDVQQPENGLLLAVSGGYIPYRFLEFDAVIQKGKLQEGVHSKAKSGMRYKNDFLSAGINFKFFPFHLMRQENQKIQQYLNLYAGIGVNGIFSNVRSAQVEDPDAGRISHYQGLNLLVPLELGYTLPLYTYYNIPVYTEVHEKHILFQISYKYNLTNTDKLDGYIPISEYNKSNDGFMQITFGIVYLF